jgi:EAL and modified HD-GYP domain-containing signal transduction protein
MTTEIMVGRQPILNRHQEVVGYELLFRSPESKDSAHFLDGDKATSEVILNVFSSIGLQNIVGNEIAFINITKSFITGKFPIPFPPQNIIIEILEDIPPTPEVIEGLRRIARLGYRFALDDVVDINKARSFLPFVKIVKLDLPHLDNPTLLQLLHCLKQLEKKVIIEKVETLEQFDYCRKIGCDFFQGYFFCKPNIVKSRRLDASRLILLNTLAKIQDPKVDFKALEEMIIQDVTLSYKLLRIVNSALFATASQITSIRQAISLIGTEYLSGWLTLMLMSTVHDKPHELTNIALIRARFCEMLAKARKIPNPANYFTVGLLSVLDALLDIQWNKL